MAKCREKLPPFATGAGTRMAFRDLTSLGALAFFGASVHQKLGSARGEITVRQLKLSARKGLFERRKERIEQLQLLLDRIEGMAPGVLRSLLEDEVIAELASDKPYSAIARAFVRQARMSAPDRESAEG